MACVEENIIRGPKDDEPLPQCSVGKYLLGRLRQHGMKIAQVFPLSGESFTFDDLLSRAVTFALELRRRGVEKDDLVVVVMGTVPEMSPVFLGVLFHGAAVVPLNPVFDEGDLKRVCGKLKPKIMFFEQDILEKGRTVLEALDETPIVLPIRMPEPATLVECQNFQIDHGPDYLERTAIILSSSGTTGYPKSITITNRAYFSQHMRVKASGHFISCEDINIQLSGLFWLSGILQQILNFDLGFLNIIMPSFKEKHMFEAIQKFRVSFVLMPPNHALGLAKFQDLPRYDITSLRLICIGGAMMSAETQALVVEKLKVKSCQLYGMSESLVVTLGIPGIKIGSIGVLLPGTEVKIVDPQTGQALGPNEVGELLVRSSSVTKGYYNDPQATAETIDSEGWLHSGDALYYDDEGYFYIVDRYKELIKYKGHHVPPVELETLLISHPGVKEAAVVGRKHDLDQEHATAFVVRQPGATVTGDELIRMVQDNLSEIKWLYGGVIFLDELPKTVTGKIMKRQLRESLSP